MTHEGQIMGRIAERLAPRVPGLSGNGLYQEVESVHLLTLGLRQFFAEAGLDPEGEELLDTPARVHRALQEFTAGYRQDPADVLARTFQVEEADGMVVVRDVPFTSLCAHHLLPFAGKAHIAYLPQPGARVVGLSKIPRVLDIYARRLQTQERLGAQVVAALDGHLDTDGSACVLVSEHGCMAHRGVRKAGAAMATSTLTGAFRANPETRAEFFALAGMR